MDRIFNGDNKFFRGLSKIVDAVIASACWIICNLLLIMLITIAFGTKLYFLLAAGLILMPLSGPGTSALYYAVVKNIRHGHSYVWKEFWRGFKESFKQATVCGLILYFLTLLFAGDAYILTVIIPEVAPQYATYAPYLTIFFLVLLFLVIMWGTYVFAFIARFENNVKGALKNSALVAIANLPKSFLQGVLFLAVLFILVFYPPLTVIFMFFMPTVYMYIKSALVEKTFRKYMSEEDIAEEDERNRDYEK